MNCTCTRHCASLKIPPHVTAAEAETFLEAIRFLFADADPAETADAMASEDKIKELETQLQALQATVIQQAAVNSVRQYDPDDLRFFAETTCSCALNTQTNCAHRPPASVRYLHRRVTKLSTEAATTQVKAVLTRYFDEAAYAPHLNTRLTFLYQIAAEILPETVSQTFNNWVDAQYHLLQQPRTIAEEKEFFETEVLVFITGQCFTASDYNTQSLLYSKLAQGENETPGTYLRRWEKLFKALHFNHTNDDLYTLRANNTKSDISAKIDEGLRYMIQRLRNPTARSRLLQSLATHVNLPNLNSTLMEELIRTTLSSIRQELQNANTASKSQIQGLKLHPNDDISEISALVAEDPAPPADVPPTLAAMSTGNRNLPPTLTVGGQQWRLNTDPRAGEPPYFLVPAPDARRTWHCVICGFGPHTWRKCEATRDLFGRPVDRNAKKRCGDSEKDMLQKLKGSDKDKPAATEKPKSLNY